VSDGVVEVGGVSFSADQTRLATVLIGSRIASRVLVRVGSFTAVSFAQLYQRAAAVEWAKWIAPGTPVRLRVTCKKSRLYHSDAVAERVASAITAAVRRVEIVAGAADDDEGTDPAQLIVVRFAHDECTISIDAAGEALHRRGYRQAVAKAPLRETLAAAMLAGAGWEGTTPLVDPMCGSGTIIIEGALKAHRIAPGRTREFAAERWPAAQATVWSTVRTAAADAEIAEIDIPLEGSDRDAGAISAALANAERAGVSDSVSFAEHALSDATAPAPSGLLITNPPYGIRVGEEGAVRDLYARFGQVARTEFAGWRVALLSADRTAGHSLERQLRLPLKPVWRSSNGGIPVRLLVGDVPR
jgi:putative N6-adenine-specific DNA methylase